MSIYDDPRAVPVLFLGENREILTWGVNCSYFFASESYNSIWNILIEVIFFQKKQLDTSGHLGNLDAFWHMTYY